MSSSITVNLTVNVHAGRWRQGDEEEVITKWLSRKCVICDAFLRPANKHPTCGACYSAAFHSNWTRTCRSASYWAREPTGAFLSQPAAGAEAEGRPAADIPDGAGAAGDSASESASKPAEEAAALPVDKNK